LQNITHYCLVELFILKYSKFYSLPSLPSDNFKIHTQLISEKSNFDHEYGILSILFSETLDTEKNVLISLLISLISMYTEVTQGHV